MVTVCHAVHTITWPFSTPFWTLSPLCFFGRGGGGAVSHGVIFLLLVLANVTWPALATGVLHTQEGHSHLHMINEDYKFAEAGLLSIISVVDILWLILNSFIKRETLD